MLLRTTLMIALSAPLLVNCSAVFEGLEGKTTKDDGKTVESPIESPRTASVLGNPVEEGAKDCVPKSGYGQVPSEGDKETDYPTDKTPPAGDTEQNQSPSQSDDPKKDDKPSQDDPKKDEPKEDGKPSSEDPGKDQPVEDCK